MKISCNSGKPYVVCRCCILYFSGLAAVDYLTNPD
jgi:hypothetical protein